MVFPKRTVIQGFKMKFSQTHRLRIKVKANELHGSFMYMNPTKYSKFIRAYIHNTVFSNTNFDLPRLIGILDYSVPSCWGVKSRPF